MDQHPICGGGGGKGGGRGGGQRIVVISHLPYITWLGHVLSDMYLLKK